MKEKVSRQFFYNLFALGISFESFVLMLGAPISFTDLTVLSLIIYSIVVNQKVLFNWFLSFVLLLGIYIFVANMINFHIEEDFFLGGFFSNYLRILAIMVIILVTPSALKGLDLKKLAKGILFAIKFHSLIVIFDPLIVYPWTFDDYGLAFGWESNESLPSERGRGLWAEPSYFAAFIGLMMALVLQFERNIKGRVTSAIDYLIIFLALLASASVTGASIAGLLVIMNMLIHRKKIFQVGSIAKTISIFLAVIVPISILLSASLVFVSDRLAAGLAGGSTLQRLVGSTLFTIDIAKEKPLIGSGLGGKNQQAFLDKYGEPILANALQQADGEAVLSQSATTFWAGLSGAGGLPTLFIFYFLILGNLILNRQTFYFGTMIFFIGISKGGVFDVSLWFAIALAISYRYYNYPNLNLPKNS